MMSLAILLSIVTGRAMSFLEHVDVLRNLILDCPWEEVNLLAELPLRASNDILAYLDYLDGVQRSSCKPIAMIAAMTMMRMIERLADERDPEVFDRFPQVELTPDQKAFAVNDLPKLSYIYIFKAEPTLEIIMNAAVSQRSPGFIAGLAGYQFANAKLLAEVTGLTSENKVALLSSIMIFKIYSMRSPYATLDLMFTGLEYSLKSPAIHVLAEDDEFVAYLHLNMVEQARERLLLILKTKGFSGERIQRIRAGFNPDVAIDWLVDLQEARATLARENEPQQVLSLKDLAANYCNKMIASLTKPKADDRDYLTLFLDDFERYTLSGLPMNKEILKDNPLLAHIASKLVNPGIEEHETIRSFRTLKTLEDGDETFGLVPPCVLLDKVINGASFVKRLEDTLESAQIVERNSKRCMGDAFPNSVLIKYDLFFEESDEVLPYSDEWYYTTRFFPDGHPLPHIRSRIKTFKISEPAGTTHYLIDTIANCQLMVRNHAHLLLAPAARKVIFQPSKSSDNIVFVYDESAIVPRQLGISYNSMPSLVAVDLTSDAEFAVFTQKFPFSPEMYPTFLNVQTGRTIEVPDWFHF